MLHPGGTLLSTNLFLYICCTNSIYIVKLGPVSIGKVYPVPYHLAFMKYMCHFHSRGSPRVICRASRKSNNVGFFPRRMANLHGGFQKMTSHRSAFPCIATCFAKFVRINLTWTYNYLIICKYGKQNPIFNTIKYGRAHRACSVQKRDTQG